MRRLLIDTIERVVPNDRRAWFGAWACGFIDASICVAVVYYWPR